MQQVLRPVSKENPLTGGYTVKHKGYDHDDKPDQNYYASFSGIVSQAKNSETKNWRNKGTLTTNDYGNYLIITGKIDGKTIKQLGAHFEPETVLQKGTQVNAGQIVAKIGNTGNSTGSHCHTEYRDSNNHNFEVDFIDSIPADTKCFLTKEQFSIDGRKATLGEYPNDDEKAADLQMSKNAVEYLEGWLKGDPRARNKWLEEWGIDQTQTKWFKVAEDYKQANEDLKVVLGMPLDADTQEISGRVQGILESNLELEKLQKPKTIYKYHSEDFAGITFWGMLIGFMRR